MQVVGIDIGAQKTMMVQENADIILTSTGSISRPSLVAFYGQTRLCGEDAIPQIAGDSTIGMINTLIGKTLQQCQASAAFPHRKVAFSTDPQGRLLASVSYCDHSEEIPVTALLAMFLTKLYERVLDVVEQPKVAMAIAVAPNLSNSAKRAFREACLIADISPSLVHLVDASDCLVATYERKLSALLPSERVQLEVRQLCHSFSLSLSLSVLSVSLFFSVAIVVFL